MGGVSILKLLTSNLEIDINLWYSSFYCWFSSEVLWKWDESADAERKNQQTVSFVILAGTVCLFLSKESF